MADEITQKHLQRARVRGAPSTIPGSAGLVQAYDYDELVRPVSRTLSKALDADFTMAELRATRDKLAQHAAKQKLKVLEQALIVLHGDPVEDPPHEWKWVVELPVSGRATGDEEAGISVSRLHGGAYVTSVTTKGFKDLRNVYAFFFGRLLPMHKQRLTRAEIYHRIVDGIEQDDPGKVSIEVLIPFHLTLEQPKTLVTRETMG
ncbi:MAG: hypothetical protein KC731_39050 [Myxococcales bacterium]|nr:hypothetical protein [Myxococcales bacterium]